MLLNKGLIKGHYTEPNKAFFLQILTTGGLKEVACLWSFEVPVV